MVNNSKVLGILFPNNHDRMLGELTVPRTCASVPYAGRYRMIDFSLSGFSQAGVEQVAMLVTRNYISLMDHIGNGREWDFAGRGGGIRLFPPYSTGDRSTAIMGEVGSLHGILGFIESCTEEYVVLSDCNVVCMIDYRELFATHRQSGADITAVYVKSKIAKNMATDNVTFEFDNDGRCTEVLCNDYQEEERNLSLSVYVVQRKLLCELVKEAHVRSKTSLARDILARNSEKLNIRGYEHKEFFKFIHDKKSFFDANMSLLHGDGMNKLFVPKAPVYTKVRGEAPVRYTVDSDVKNSIIADGALIAGTVENSILFRGVKVEKGAVVRNCVLMQDTVVSENTTLDYVITDKNVTVSGDKEVKGTDLYPVYIQKGETV